LRAALDELGDVALVQTYGMTEGTPLASLSPEDHRAALTEDLALLRTVGRAAPGVELRIVDGEVHARGDHLFAPDDDGWLRTGDAGEIDDRGYLTLRGRVDDVISRGGEKVHPEDVEAVLASHPAVREVAVASVPDPTMGEAVGAFVVPSDGGSIDETELRAFARERLSGHKVPSVWRVISELPRNSAGKVMRRALPRDA
jgi:acyl-CoA synthetase (AMP-forming)/AMP-acid ligase II